MYVFISQPIGILFTRYEVDINVEDINLRDCRAAANVTAIRD